MTSLEGGNILITGGASCLGSHLVERLAPKRPAKIIVADNLSTGTYSNLVDAKDSYPSLVFRNMDVSHERPLERLIAENDFDIIFNLATLPLLASYQAPLKVWDNNLDTAKTLLEQLRQDKYRLLVHVSTSEVYGEMVENPMTEDHPQNPSTVYGASKAAEDLLIQAYDRQYGIPFIIARPFNLYGPRQQWGRHGPIIPRTIQKMLRGDPPTLYMDGTQSRDYVYVEDVADALARLAETSRAVGETVNICSGRALTIRYVIQLLCLALGYEGEIRVAPNPRPNDVRHLRGCNRRLRSLIVFEPSMFEDNLGRIVEWYMNVFEAKKKWEETYPLSTN